MGETAEDAVIKCLGLPLTPWYSEDEVVYPGAQECLAGLRDKYSIIAENQNIEQKESWRDEYLRWICGFANAQGGKIYIGKSDDGTVIGVKDVKKLLEDIPNKIQNKMGCTKDHEWAKK